MKIPKEIVRNKRRYVFVKRVNKKLFLYKTIDSGLFSCFDMYDLGMIKETQRTFNIKPENVVFR